MSPDKLARRVQEAARSLAADPDVVQPIDLARLEHCIFLEGTQGGVRLYLDGRPLHWDGEVIFPRAQTRRSNPQAGYPDRGFGV